MGVVLGAEDSTEVVSTVVDSGSTGDSDVASDLDAALDMDAASDFMVAIPTFMAGMDMAAVLITTAPTCAIEQHGALLQWRAVAATHNRAVIAAAPRQIPTGAFEGAMNMTRVDRILFALSVMTASLPLGITYAMLLAR